MWAAHDAVRTVMHGVQSAETAEAWVRSKYHVRSFKAGEQGFEKEPYARDSFQVCLMVRDPKFSTDPEGNLTCQHVTVLSKGDSWEDALRNFAGERAVEIFRAELSRKS